jgi:hypothetical protein
MGGTMKIARTMGVLLGSWLGLAAQAAEPGDLQFSGFATLGGVVLDDRSVNFVRSVGLNKPGGGWLDLGSDSVLGVQMNAGLGSRSDFTLQLRAAEDSRGHYDPEVGWAFLRHVWSPELSTRIGRLRVPFFMLSDSVQVNFAHPWVRLPPEVYGLNPFNDLDGADLLYRTDVGAAELELRPYFGRGRIEFPVGEGRLRGARGINIALSRGPLSVHVGHGESRLEIRWDDPSFRELKAALEATGHSAVAKDLSGRRGHARFDSLGVQWDDGVWLAAGEFIRLRADRYVNSNHAWFVSVGRRVDDFTPYVRVARQVRDEPASDAQLAIPALDRGLQGFLTSRNLAQRSVALGGRWDVAPDVALKTEYAWVRIADKAWGSFIPRDFGDPFAQGGRSIHMLSLSVDWVF